MVIRRMRTWIESQSLLKLLGIIVGAGAVLGVLIPLLLIGGQRWAVSRARRAHPAPGQVVDVSGQELHLYCDGAAEPGEAVVVIDADIAAFSLDWVAIQRAMVDDHRVCLYDRAGYGWSEAVAEARTADRVTLELHALLAASGEPGPYVLVGHGLGAVNVQLYAAKYAVEVAGLVLVHPLTEVVLGDAYGPGWQRRLDFYEQMRGLTASGLLGLVRPVVRATRPPWVGDLPEDVREIYLALVLDRAYYDTAIEETELLAVSLGQVRSALRGDLPLQGLPLVVLTAARSASPAAAPYAQETVPTPEDVVAAHRAIAAFSIRGERRMLGRSA
jgi:pimeloyl-ACP methyl ester carboxylesterase